MKKAEVEKVKISYVTVKNTKKIISKIEDISKKFQQIWNQQACTVSIIVKNFTQIQA